MQVLSDGAVPWVLAMWALGALVFLYVVLGGMRAASLRRRAADACCSPRRSSRSASSPGSNLAASAVSSICSPSSARRRSASGAPRQGGYNALFRDARRRAVRRGLRQGGAGRRRLDDLDGAVDGPLADGLATRAGIRHRWPFRRATRGASRPSRSGLAAARSDLGSCFSRSSRASAHCSWARRPRSMQASLGDQATICRRSRAATRRR